MAERINSPKSSPKKPIQFNLRKLYMALLIAPPAIWGLFEGGKTVMEKVNREIAKSRAAAAAKLNVGSKPAVARQVVNETDISEPSEPGAFVVGSDNKVEGIIGGTNREKQALLGMDIEDATKRERVRDYQVPAGYYGGGPQVDGGFYPGKPMSRGEFFQSEVWRKLREKQLSGEMFEGTYEDENGSHTGEDIVVPQGKK
jgi:hypothetical protein